MLDVKVRGIESIDAALREVEAKVQRRVLRAALRKAGNVVRDEARRRAPVQSGLLRRNIRTVVGRSRSTGQWTASIGLFPPPRRKDGKKSKEWAYYSLWVEKGHLIVPRRRSRQEALQLTSVASPSGRWKRENVKRWTRKRSLRERRTEAAAAGRRVAPRPFLLPALVAKQAEAHRVLMEELRKGLEEALGGSL